MFIEFNERYNKNDFMKKKTFLISLDWSHN